VDAATFDDNISEQIALANDELVEFHQFQERQEGDDHLGLGSGGLEQLLETPCFAGLKIPHEQFNLVRYRVTIIDDIAEIMGFLEALEDILESTDQVENRDFRECWRSFRWHFLGIRLVGEAALLLELPQRKEAGGVFEFFVFDELTDKFPTRIVVLRIFLGRLLHPRQQGAAFQIHQIGSHHDELGGKVNIEQLEGVDVVEILPGDVFDGNRVDVDLVFFDEVEQEVERTFEDFEADFVVVGFHGAGGTAKAD